MAVIIDIDHFITLTICQVQRIQYRVISEWAGKSGLKDDFAGRRWEAAEPDFLLKNVV
jgi:hypothetical protein